jgi:hypothetical protein
MGFHARLQHGLIASDQSTPAWAKSTSLFIEVGGAFILGFE